MARDGSKAEARAQHANTMPSVMTTRTRILGYILIQSTFYLPRFGFARRRLRHGGHAEDPCCSCHYERALDREESAFRCHGQKADPSRQQRVLVTTIHKKRSSVFSVVNDLRSRSWEISC